MIRIVYVSTANKLDFADTELDALVAQAQHKNQANDITGLLVFNGLNFMQALEGRDEIVLAVMAAIAKDPRHSGVVIVSQSTIDTRAFPDWSMCLTRSSRANHDPQALLRSNGIPAELLVRADETLSRLFTNFNALA